LVWIAFATGLAPKPLVLVFWGLGLGRVVVAAMRLGVFEALEGGPRSAEEIAGSLGCAEASMTTLLNALNGFGFLRRRRGRYSLSRMSRRWLLASSKGSLREMTLFLGDLFQAVEPMEEAIRTGEVTNFHHRPHGSETWGHYVRGLGTVAKTLGAEIARKVPVDGPPKRLLDVAGGHGQFAIALCRRFPGLTADVLDLPGAVEHGRDMVHDEGMSDVISYREGDLRTLDWGEGYDIVLLCNILHNLEAAECELAFAKARSALREGGTVVVADSEHSGIDGDLEATAGFNELFFFLVSGSQAWPEPTLRRWMSAAGFSKVRRRRSLMLPGLIMLTALAS
jgi:ubiquinone/menaquinone biosynthesis C-methylase UbiE